MDRLTKVNNMSGSASENLKHRQPWQMGAIPVKTTPKFPDLIPKVRNPRGPEPDMPHGNNARHRGVYIISVAAKLLEMHPQTLRKYERLGLVTPYRTIGMLRLYSDHDIQKLRLIRHLEISLGLNLAGVEFTLSVLDNIVTMSRRLWELDGNKQLTDAIKTELTLLFQKLNIPFQE